MENQETEEGLRRRAYMIGLKLKNSNLDKETIYARLEKQGIPTDLALQVANDIMQERKKDSVEDEKPRFYTALIGVFLGIVLAIVSSILIPGKIILSIGLIFGGIIYSIFSYLKMKN